MNRKILTLSTLTILILTIFASACSDTTPTRESLQEIPNQSALLQAAQEYLPVGIQIPSRTPRPDQRAAAVGCLDQPSRADRKYHSLGWQQLEWSQVGTILTGQQCLRQLEHPGCMPILLHQTSVVRDRRLRSQE